MKIKSIIAITLMSIFLLIIGQGFKEIYYSFPYMMAFYILPSLAFSVIQIKRDNIRPKRFMNLTKNDFIISGYWASTIFVFYSLSKLINEQTVEEIIKDSTFRLSIWTLFVVYTFSNYEKSKQFRTKRSTE